MRRTPVIAATRAPLAPTAVLSPDFVQCDDYEGYGSEVTLPDGIQRALVDPDIRLGCMMHVSRPLYSALQLGDKRAAHAVSMCVEKRG